MTLNKPTTFFLIFVLIFLTFACDPLAQQPTPETLIITAVPSETPAPTATVFVTFTPVPTFTPVVTATPTPVPCDEDGGQIITIDPFRSTVAGENLRYNVYIPPCYAKTQKRYPYVILLHGASNTEKQWDKLGIMAALDQGLRLGALPPMILVMPYTGSIANDNTFPPDPSYETVILDELMPAVERDFCTWSDRAHKAIGGISRGGFWAFSIALRHPDIFGIIGGHSAAFTDDPAEVPPAFNPLELALNSALLPGANLRMYLDNGANDLAGVNQELFSSRLSARAIPHTYVVNPVGEHNDAYWSAHVSEYLAFYGRDWPRDTTALPSCLQPSP
ncbi:MAG: alpha/beta hydrolase-fold protein [Chloroflexota bacterium]